MNPKLPLEAFLLKTKTEDNYNVIIGGLCPKGKKKEASNIYSKIDKMKIGQSKDEFLIDHILATIITRISPIWISLVGASISIDGVKHNTGGIIGDPFKEQNSAQEEIEEILEGIYVISFPGGPGVAFSGTYKDSIVIKDIISEYKSCNNSFEYIIESLNKITDLYIVVSDGSGINSCGGIYVSDNDGKRSEEFL